MTEKGKDRTEKDEKKKSAKKSKDGMQLYELAKELGLTSRKLRSFFVSKRVRIPEKQYTFIRLTPSQVEMARDVFIRRHMVMRRPFRARREQKEVAEERLGIKRPERRPRPPYRPSGPRRDGRAQPSGAPPRTPDTRRPGPPPRRRGEEPVRADVPPPPKEPPRRRVGERKPVSKETKMEIRARKRLLRMKREGLQKVDVESELYEGPARTQGTIAKSVKEKPRHVPQRVKRPEHLELEPPVTIREFSAALGVKAAEIIRKLMQKGMRIAINDAIPDEHVVELALEYGTDLVLKRTDHAEQAIEELERGPGDAKELAPRPPIVAFLGHVDHGKTSLLDRIRGTDVAGGEAGGITQHISACQVNTRYGPISFVDTPGHEAFTALRARGAQVTDMVVLVVAADDGVMPQTEEAYSHAKAAEVPVLVALNKVDKPNADRLRAKRQLGELGLVTEEWGGDTIVVECSAVTGEGIDNLLEMISIMSEMLEPRADPTRPAKGFVVESSLSEGEGVVTTILVRDGTLKIGDVLLCGPVYGRVRNMVDWRGNVVNEAPPSMAVSVTGLPQPPEAGEKFYVVADVQKARTVATEIGEGRKKTPPAARHITLESFYEHIRRRKVQELLLILKADAKGSLEAINKILSPLTTEEVSLKILHEGVGAVSESDVLLADASDAVVISFNVDVTEGARTEARVRGVQIREYKIIYELAQDMRAALEGMLEPEEKEVRIGRLVVRAAFQVPKFGKVAGCYVQQGKIERTSHVRVYRGEQLVAEGKVETLKRFKDDVREVTEGYECGVCVKGYKDVEVDDVIEVFTIEKVARRLEL